MIISKKVTLLLFAVLTVGMVEAQCSKEHMYCDKGKDKNFQISNQSKSASFGPGEEHEMSMILYSGKAYRISFCTSSEEYEGKIEFELYTIKSKQVYDSKNDRETYVREPEILYSNREDNMNQVIEFQADGTKKIYIKVFVPEGASEGGKKNKLAAADVVCVGVLVQHQKGTRTGFH